MQYTEIFPAVKIENFIRIVLIFLIFLFKSKIEGTLRTASNEYQQSMFWVKNKKNMATPVNPSFSI